MTPGDVLFCADFLGIGGGKSLEIVECIAVVQEGLSKVPL
jgi:hypothetical protein